MVTARHWAQRLLGAVLAACAVLLAVRTFAGPITSPVTFYSPINVESALGLAVILLLLVRAGAKPQAAATGRRALDRWDALGILIVLALVAAAFWQAAHFYFLSDDFILLKQARSFSYSFRGLFANKGLDGSYRPVTNLCLGSSYSWAGTNPLAWHALNLAIHAANSVLVFLLAWMLGFSRLSTALASVLFAVHASRPEAVVWLAARGDLLATFFVLLGLVCFIRAWELSGGLSWICLFVSVMAGTLAILSKESAYTFPLLPAAYLASRRALRSRRACWVLLPFFAVAAALLAWRFILLGGIGGYVNAAGQPEVLSVSPLAVVKTFALRLWAVLFFPVNWSNSPGVLFGCIMLLYLAALLWLARASMPWRSLSLLLGFVLILALPPLSQLLIGMDLQKARYLYLPSVGFCLLLAAATQRFGGKPQWAVSIIIVAFNLAALLHNLNAWDYAAQRAKPACAMAAAYAAGPDARIAVVGLPHSINGVYFFANGFQECAEMERRGDSGGIELKEPDQPLDRSRYSGVLSWDNARGALAAAR